MVRCQTAVCIVLAVSLSVAPIPALGQATVDADPTGDEGSQAADLYTGFAVRDISPYPGIGEDGDGNVYLGGFGLGPGRLSEGISSPISARAAVISDGEDAVALASVEVQGMFSSYRAGDYGSWDVIERVSDNTDLTRDDVMISSDHSHRSPDTVGAWGFVPDEYAWYVANQTQAAIEAAYEQADTKIAEDDPDHVTVGIQDGGKFQYSEFSSPLVNSLDRPIRVLAAEDAETGEIEGVYGEFAAHPVLKGSANGIHPDWPGMVAEEVSERVNAPAVVAVGAIGRTQEVEHPRGIDTDEEWVEALTDRVVLAIEHGDPIVEPEVDSDTDMVTLTGWNVALTGLTAAGEQGCKVPVLTFTCVPIQRDPLPPWQAGNVLRTLVTTASVGDVLLWGAPGEIYPEAHFFVQEHVDARAHFIQGLTNDQLGYIVAPSEAWPTVAANAAASDNALFNIDITAGDHLACAAVDSAAEIGLDLDPGKDMNPSRCNAWALEDRRLPNERDVP